MEGCQGEARCTYLKQLVQRYIGIKLQFGRVFIDDCTANGRERFQETRVTRKFNLHTLFSESILHFLEGPSKDDSPLVNQCDPFAELFGLFHHVSRKDDGLAL